jgi:peptidoglycan/xylan/chitin deacetylase (PgdA/CDA1 family)
MSANEIFNPIIPVVMYHEITSNRNNKGKTNSLTPLYNIPVSQFEKQIRILSENGYKSLFFQDATCLKVNGKYIIITFDDGLKGTYEYALPILKAHGFKAVFFVAVDRIGSERYMDWTELSHLVSQGMSVQSHTMSHRPLQTLNSEEVKQEFSDSKRILESKLNNDVSAISFPHGSYSKKIISIAQETGYHFICTSDVERVDYKMFNTDSVVLGRIAMTTEMSPSKFIDSIKYKRWVLWRLKLAKKTKNIIKSIMGIETYRWLYRRYFKIKIS